MTRTRRAALLTVLLLAPAASAHAATLTVPTAVTRSDCATTRLAGAAGTMTTRYTASRDESFTARLAGGGASDWDLAVFKSDTHDRMAGSGAFGADEVVTLLLRKGESVDVQACRIAGASSVPLTFASQPVALAPLGSKPPTGALISIAKPSRAQHALITSLGLDLGHDAAGGDVSAVADDPAQLTKLRAAGVRFTTLIPDLAAQDRADRAAEARATPRASVLPSGRTTYRHLEDYQAELKALATDHPALVKPITLPRKTFQGREQMGVEISSNVGASDDAKPTSFIMGVHHAREWPGGEIPMEFAEDLVAKYGSDPEVTDLLNRVRVVVVPIINPDGFVASRDAPIDLADATGDPAGAPSLLEAVAPPGGSLAYRRKNCFGAVPSPSAPCAVQHGVDPNRNYGFNWGGYGASSDVNSQSYRGAGPWSEQETKSVHEFSQKRDVTTLMTMHTFASLVLRPPGVSTDGLAPDEDALKKLGDAMGADTGYTSQFSYELYDTSGTTEDWNYGAAGTYGYTIEMGPASEQGGNFHTSYQQGVIDQWTGTGDRAGRGLRRALLRIAGAAADTSQFSSLNGRAPAGRTLRLRKTFKTSTSPVCTIADPVAVSAPGGATDCIAPQAPQTIDDELDYTTKVPANGSFAWLVTPSTRPFVAKKGGSEQWTLTCEDGAGKVLDSKQVTIARGQAQTLNLPCGTTLPAAAPAGTKDRLAPQSRFTKASLKATRKGLQLAGTSADFAPAGLTPKHKSVSVALGRRVGKLCRFATASGAFGAKVSCLRTKYVKASGTATWTLLFRHSLAKGRYIAWVRGTDVAGNVEKKAKPRNLLTFEVK